MAAVKEQRDLCCICTYRAKCMDHGTAGSPKLFCEEFDSNGHAPLILVQSDNGSARLHRFDEANHGDDVGGLCSNCENRSNCTIARPEGHIWHCEEYR
jgi:hypothetical protein